ncbi:MAG: TatD family hydrolase [Candidatus Omnitrophota bacterium]|nr:TatD family hydrolase [Candidatus Omnitrophota bacterium]
MLVDTHCHLDFPEFDADRDEVINRAKEQGVGYIINIGASLEGSKKSVELSQKYASIYATVGIHPHEADSFTPETEKSIRNLAKEKKVVAIGEIGLDYFKHYSEPRNQLPVFTQLLKIAKDFNLPVVIHTRNAQVDTLKVLKEAMPVKAVVHCFSGDKVFLKVCLDLGFLVSFTCNITYPAKLSNSRRDPALAEIDWRDKKAEDLRAIVKAVPLDRLLLETDAPYLSPEGFRGKRNEPAQVCLLAETVANLKGLKLEEVSKATTENARGFFNLPETQ